LRNRSASIWGPGTKPQAAGVFVDADNHGAIILRDAVLKLSTRRWRRRCCTCGLLHP
jgi:hypothetical protein